MGIVRKTTYLAEARLHRMRSRWRADRPRTSVTAEPPAVEPVAPAGLAELIALAASGRARLEVATVGVTWRNAPARQRWIGLEPATGGALPTIAVMVQGQ